MSRILSLKDLPSVSTDKQGWPWDLEPEPIPDRMPGGTDWPPVTVVTPSYNQGAYLEETIRSVLLQGYPALDYIIIDGGSTDGTVDIIRKYEQFLCYWESEKDRGQCHAINKGFAKARPGIWAFLNSDDTYLEGTVAKAALNLSGLPGVQLVYASVLHTGHDGTPLHYYRGIPLRKGLSRMEFWKGWHIPQASVFMKSELVEQYGGLCEDFHLGLDYEWFIRFSGHAKFACIDDVWATAKIHPEAKTGDWESNKKFFYIENHKANRLNTHIPGFAWLYFKYFLFEKLKIDPAINRLSLNRRLKQAALDLKYYNTNNLSVANYLTSEEIFLVRPEGIILIRYGRLRFQTVTKSSGKGISVFVPVVFAKRPAEDYLSVTVLIENEALSSNRQVQGIKLSVNGKKLRTGSVPGHGEVAARGYFHLSELNDQNEIILRIALPFVCALNPGRVNGFTGDESLLARIIIK